MFQYGLFTILLATCAGRQEEVGQQHPQDHAYITQRVRDLLYGQAQPQRQHAAHHENQGEDVRQNLNYFCHDILSFSTSTVFFRTCDPRKISYGDHRF